MARCPGPHAGLLCSPCRPSAALALLLAAGLPALVLAEPALRGAAAELRGLEAKGPYEDSDQVVVVEEEEDARTSSAEGGEFVELLSDSDLPAGEGVPCWSGLQTVPEFLACLAAIPIHPDRRDCALAIISSHLDSLYVYSGLVRNSSDNDAKLPSGFSFSVHNLTLGPEMDKLWAELQVERSAGFFALKLSRFFAMMQDAHTAVLVNPLVRTRFTPPVVVDVGLNNVSGNMAFTVANNTSWSPPWVVGKTVSSVNGVPAQDYFLEVASVRPQDRSGGARLNRYLKQQYVLGLLPPDEGAFNVVFTDGSRANLSWRVNFTSTCGFTDVRVCSRPELLEGNCTDQMKVMELCFLYNRDFKNVLGTVGALGFSTPCSDKGKLLSTLRSSIDAFVTDNGFGEPVAVEFQEEEEEEEWGPWRRLLPDSGLGRPHRGKAAAAAAGDPGRAGDPGSAGSARVPAWQGPAPIQVVANVTGSCQALKVRLADGSHAAVLKLMQFGSFTDVYCCAKAAVDLAAEVADGKLIIDVIGNGGGAVSAGYDLNHYLYKNMPGSSIQMTWDACEWYDYPRTQELTWLIELSERPLPGVHTPVGSKEHILALATRMKRAAQALAEDRYYYGKKEKAWGLGNASVCLGVLVSRFESPELQNNQSSAWRQFQALYKQCLTAAAPIGASRGADIMGYTWSNAYPDVLSAPSWDHYRAGVQKRQGGATRNFTRLAFVSGACEAYGAVFPDVFGATVLGEGSWPVEPQSKLKQITYLSDGLCGSTCSVSSTSPYLDGLATFVTYGGVKGQPMDITSFNGGNVAEYQAASPRSDALWKSALGSFADAHVFFPEEAPPSWPFLPLPLNIYKLSFAQRAEYPRALGQQALPREWYLIPASHHLDIWTRADLNSDVETLSPADALKLHELYAATARLPAKPFVRQ